MTKRPTTILLSAEESLRLARENAARNKKNKKRGSSAKRPTNKDIFKAMMADAGARLAAMKKNK